MTNFKKFLNFNELKEIVLKNKTLSIIFAIDIILFMYRFIMIGLYSKEGSSDSSIIPLMANHILKYHEHFIFYWGQAYMGVPEAYLMAVIGAFQGQVTSQIANVTTLIIYLIFSLASSYLLFRMTKKYLYFFIAFFIFSVGGIVITPSDFGGYTVCNCLGSLIMLLGYMHIWEGKINYKTYYSLIGLLTGIGLWSHIMIIEFFIPLIILDIFLVKRSFDLNSIKKSIVSATLLIVTFFIGSLPFWLWNIQHNFDTIFRIYLGQFGQIHTSKIIYVHHLQQTIDAFFQSVYNILFLNSYNPINIFNSPVYFVMSLVYLLAFIYALVYFPKETTESKSRGVSGIIIFFLVIVFSFLFMAFSIPGLTNPAPSNYYSMMEFAIIPILALFIGKVYEKVKILSIILLFLTFTVYAENIPLNYTVPDNIDTAISIMNENNTKYCFWDYWNAYLVDLRTQESIICSPVLGDNREDKYPQYTDQVMASDKAAFVISTANEINFTNLLNKLNITGYKEKRFETGIIFYPISNSSYKKILIEWIKIDPNAYDSYWYITRITGNK